MVNTNKRWRRRMISVVDGNSRLDVWLALAIRPTTEVGRADTSTASITKAFCSKQRWAICNDRVFLSEKSIVENRIRSWRPKISVLEKLKPTEFYLSWWILEMKKKGEISPSTSKIPALILWMDSSNMNCLTSWAMWKKRKQECKFKT